MFKCSFTGIVCCILLCGCYDGGVPAPQVKFENSRMMATKLGPVGDMTLYEVNVDGDLYLIVERYNATAICPKVNQ